MFRRGFEKVIVKKMEKKIENSDSPSVDEAVRKFIGVEHDSLDSQINYKILDIDFGNDRFSSMVDGVFYGKGVRKYRLGGSLHLELYGSDL